MIAVADDTLTVVTAAHFFPADATTGTGGSAIVEQSSYSTGSGRIALVEVLKFTSP